MGDRTCSVRGCDKPTSARGWCSTHYGRWYRHRDLTRGRPSLEARFWPNVDTKGAPPPEPWADIASNCWLWLGTTDAKGYGIVGKSQGARVIAHRWAYEHHRGPIPDGLVIDHLCRVPHCVNPDHLEVVTSRINTLRGDTIPARYAQRDACIRGHKYEGDNFYLRGRKRVCRICHKIRVRGYRAR